MISHPPVSKGIRIGTKRGSLVLFFGLFLNPDARRGGRADLQNKAEVISVRASGTVQQQGRKINWKEKEGKENKPKQTEHLISIPVFFFPVQAEVSGLQTTQRNRIPNAIFHALQAGCRGCRGCASPPLLLLLPSQPFQGSFSPREPQSLRH